MTKPIFYSGTKNASSWAMRAWLALKAANYEFEEVVVDIRRPRRFGNLAEISTFSPPASVPVLRTASTVIFDSNAIMEFANDYSGGKLLPEDMEARARARSMVAWQHSGLPYICERISFESAFYPNKRALTAEEQTELDRLLTAFEKCLSDSGGDFLFGDVSLADFMHTPNALKFTRHKANFDAFPLTEKWMKTLLDYPFVREWIDEADTKPHIWYDSYLLPEDPKGRLLTQE